MKKLLLITGLLLLNAAYAQDCSEIFISEYVEGSGNDKALELFNPTGSSIDLSGYRIERFSNGSATSATGGVLNLSGSIAAHSAFVIANGQTNTSPSSPACSPALQAMADLLDGVYPAPTYMNGNDAIVLYNNTDMIDILGRTGDGSMTTAPGWGDEIPYDGSVGAVWTENHTLIRKSSVKSGVIVEPNPFIVNIEWDSLPENTWTNLGTHICDCPLGLDEESNSISYVVYPNPINGDYLNVQSSEFISSVEILNLLGQKVTGEVYTNDLKSGVINLDSINPGAYLVRINYRNGLFSKSNLIVQ